jgi:hypothetical protein
VSLGQPLLLAFPSLLSATCRASAPGASVHVATQQMQAWLTGTFLGLRRVEPLNIELQCHLRPNSCTCEASNHQANPSQVNAALQYFLSQELNSVTDRIVADPGLVATD